LKLNLGDAYAMPGSGELKIGECPILLIAHRTWEIAHLSRENANGRYI
jgi:hypothetical protein